MGLEPASVAPPVCPCVRLFTLSNMNISETGCPIKIKLYLEHHWGEGLAVSGFGQDRIRTLVSMATDSSQGYNGENRVTTLAPSFLISSSLFLQVMSKNHKISDGFEIRQDRTRDL